MIDPEIVRQPRALHALDWPVRRIARELGVGRGAVRRYLRGGVAADTQTAARSPTSSAPKSCGCSTRRPCERGVETSSASSSGTVVSGAPPSSQR